MLYMKANSDSIISLEKKNKKNNNRSNNGSETGCEPMRFATWQGKNGANGQKNQTNLRSIPYISHEPRGHPNEINILFIEGRVIALQDRDRDRFRESRGLRKCSEALPLH